MIFSGIPHSTIFGLPKYTRQIPYLAYLHLLRQLWPPPCLICHSSSSWSCLWARCLPSLTSTLVRNIISNYLATKHCVSQSMNKCTAFCTQGITRYQCVCSMTRYVPVHCVNTGYVPVHSVHWICPCACTAAECCTASSSGVWPARLAKSGSEPPCRCTKSQTGPRTGNVLLVITKSFTKGAWWRRYSRDPPPPAPLLCGTDVPSKNVYLCIFKVAAKRIIVAPQKKRKKMQCVPLKGFWPSKAATFLSWISLVLVELLTELISYWMQSRHGAAALLILHMNMHFACIWLFCIWFYAHCTVCAKFLELKKDLQINISFWIRGYNGMLHCYSHKKEIHRKSKPIDKGSGV